MTRQTTTIDNQLYAALARYFGGTFESFTERGLSPAGETLTKRRLLTWQIISVMSRRGLLTWGNGDRTNQVMIMSSLLSFFVRKQATLEGDRRELIFEALKDIESGTSPAKPPGHGRKKQKAHTGESALLNNKVISLLTEIRDLLSGLCKTAGIVEEEPSAEEKKFIALATQLGVSVERAKELAPKLSAVLSD